MKENKPGMDDIFRSKLGKLESGYDPQRWVEMQKLLEKEDARRKKKRIVLLVSMLMIISTAGYLFLLPVKKNEVHTNLNATGKSNVPESNKGLIINDEKASGKTISGNEKPAVNMANHSHEPAPAKNFPGGFAKNNAEEKSKPVKKNMEPAIAQSVQHGNANYHKTVPPDLLTTEENSVQSNLNVSISENSTLPVPVDSLQDTEEITRLVPLTRESLKTEVIEPILKSPGKDNMPPIGEGVRHYSFFFSAGIKLTKLVAPHAEQVKTNWLGGIEVSKNFSAPLSLNTGVFYTELNGLSLKDSSVQTSYFLDVKTSVQRLEINKIKLLSLPLYIRYTFSKRYSMLAGMTVSYLLNTKSSYSEGSYGSTGSLFSNPQSVEGYMGGIETATYAVMGGFGLSLNKNFDVNIYYRKGLNTIVNSYYFKDVNSLYDSSVNLILRYRIY